MAVSGTMPGTSRSAASIIGGMTQGLSRKAAAEFSFLSCTNYACCNNLLYFCKTWGEGTAQATKGYEMLLSSHDNLILFLIGNVIAFVTALIAIKSFIALLNKYGFKFWGIYRIVIGIALLIYFTP